MKVLLLLVTVAALAAVMARLRGRRPVHARSAGPVPSDEAFVEEYVRTAVAGGFESREQIRETALELAADDGMDDEAQIDALVNEAFAEHARAQESWPAVTDNDRLTDAFARLERDGILARQNFACCQNCGHGEMGSEVKLAQKNGPVRGYTFFHQQDTEAAASGHGLYLAYGSTKGGAKAALEVAGAVTEALRDAGLAPEWDGSLSTRIFVPMEWRRRRAT